MKRIPAVWEDATLDIPFKMKNTGDFLNIMTMENDIWRVYFQPGDTKTRTLMLTKTENPIPGSHDIVAVGSIRPLGHPEETVYYKLVELVG